ncbi:hypothetical protein J1605_019494 [Eschrichtius robustus]|uniref:Uncharacterized protein n=1 Tax=Eschrichtius robustus TaxID=9764 RepID=A0AB34HKT1_ESCRO|nr:hypothetical protein J1605_019494 [Eschrichtius robustus]
MRTTERKVLEAEELELGESSSIGGNRRNSPVAYGFHLTPEEEMRRKRLHRFDGQRGTGRGYHRRLLSRSAVPKRLGSLGPHIWMVVAVNLLCYAITLPSRDV